MYVVKLSFKYLVNFQEGPIVVKMKFQSALQAY